MSLSLASINIEGSKHLDAVAQFLQERQPEVVCLQEVFLRDLSQLVGEYYKYASFAVMANVVQENSYGVEPHGEHGIAILSRFKIQEEQATSYFRSTHSRGDEAPLYSHPNSVDRVLQTVQIEKSGFIYVIHNTHFTWTPKGEASPEQERDLAALLQLLEATPEYVLCGDFNAPRGKRTWSHLAEHLTDNIPASVKTTIDGNLHYAGNLQLVVDGIFSTPGYQVDEVTVYTGVSDHCALMTQVSVVPEITENLVE